MKVLPFIGSLAIALSLGACSSTSDIGSDVLSAPGSVGGATKDVGSAATNMATNTAKRAATNAATNAVTNKVGGGAASAVNTGRSAVNTANALR